jgi:putative transposase
MVSVPARRQQVAYSRERGLSARRACTLFSVARSALEYRSRKAAKDAPVVARMKSCGRQYPRYAYRRIRIFLHRDGHRMSPAGRTGCGRQQGCRCRASGRGSASLRRGHARKRRVDRTLVSAIRLPSRSSGTASCAGFQLRHEYGPVGKRTD